MLGAHSLQGRHEQVMEVATVFDLDVHVVAFEQKLAFDLNELLVKRQTFDDLVKNVGFKHLLLNMEVVRGVCESYEMRNTLAGPSTCRICNSCLLVFCGSWTCLGLLLAIAGSPC